MKKCPYCKTLASDNDNTCPNCLHDISQVNPMPEPINSKFSNQLYLIIFGILISIGGIVAALSQKGNMEHYYELSNQEGLAKAEISKFVSLAKQSGFEMIMMYALGVIGLVMVTIRIIFLIKKKIKKKE